MKSIKTIIAFGLLALSISCGTPHDSNLKHDDGKPVRSSLSSNWIKVDRTTFVTKVLRQPESKALAESSPITQRFQMWVDKIDAYFRTREPVLTSGVPKPSVVVLKDRNANAYVASTVVCYKVNISFGDAQKNLPNGIFLDKSSDAIDTDVPADYPCLTASNSDLSNIAQEIAAKNLSCQYTVSGDSLQFSENCQVLDKNYQSGFTSDKLLLLKTPNWFVILSGIADLLDSEETMVGVIAHELGHYYRAHSNTYKGEYDFYYTQKDAGNDKHKPIADPSLESFGKKIFQISAAYTGLSYIQRGEQYKLNPMYFLAMGDIARQVSENNLAVSNRIFDNPVDSLVDNPFAQSLPNCKLAASFEAGRNGQALSAMPFTPPSDMKVYEAFVQASMGCLDEIESLNLKNNLDVETAFKAPKWAPFTKNPQFSGSLSKLNELMKTFEVIGEGVKIPSNSIKDSIFKEAEQVLKNNIENVTKTLISAYEARLGQYTVEQEADDISVEVLSNIGLGGNAATDTYMALVRKNDSFGGLDIGKAKCQKLRENNWVDPDGVFDISIMPVGDYSENHHSSCYRVFNASREVTAHGYNKEATTQVDKSIWESMKKELARFGGASPAPDSFTLQKFDRLPKNCALNPKT